MSNNKQSMKLYTEEQVKTMLIKTDKFTPLHIEHLMNEITPIELPSDEEISGESMDLFGKNSTSINDILQYKAFKRGAKWMRNKIQGGSK
jgi:hypothetical protein